MADLKGAALALPLTWEEHELSEGYSSVVYDANGTAIDTHLSSQQAESIARMVNSHAELLRLVKRLRETAEYLARMRRRQGDDEGARLNEMFIALEIDPAIAAAEGRQADTPDATDAQQEQTAPDFEVRTEHSFRVFAPISSAARQWCIDAMPDSAVSEDGDRYTVHGSEAGDLASELAAEGFTVREVR